MIILPEKPKAWITKSQAYCIVVLIPARRITTPAGLILGETSEHWERISTNGCVVRCHTQLEAIEAAQYLSEGVRIGNWKAIAIQPYDPMSDDVPYYSWIRGVRGKRLDTLGVDERDLPESQDQGLEHLSDDEWITRGPR